MKAPHSVVALVRRRVFKQQPIEQTSKLLFTGMGGLQLRPVLAGL